MFKAILGYNETLPQKQSKQIMQRKRKRREEKIEEEEERAFVKTNKNNYNYINDSATVFSQNQCNLFQ